MDNSYIKLHQQFKQAGADVLVSSGQACVLFGISAFSQDGDWIIRENRESCLAIEQDEKMQADKERLNRFRNRLGSYPKAFAAARKRWRAEGVGLCRQHEELKKIAERLVK